MKKLLLCIGLLLASVGAANFDKKEVAQLEATLTHNIKAMNDENLEEYMKDIHPLSPAYAGTKRFLEQLFVNYDLEATHLGMTPLMIDEHYFILRGKQKTVRIKGTIPFRDNIVEALHVYKKHEGKWLLWSSMMLEIENLERKK